MVSLHAFMHAPTSAWRRRWGSGGAKLVGRSIVAWFSHDAASTGASLSFYTLFSIAPVLLVAAWVAGIVLDKNSVHERMVSEMQGLFGNSGAGGVASLLAGSAHFGTGIVPSIVGVVSLLIGATSVFAELQRALDRIWDVPAAAGASSVWQIVRTRVLSFGMILGLGFLLLVSLVVSAGLAALAAWLGTVFAQWKAILWMFDIALGLGIATLIFAMIFKFLPRRSIAWGDVWMGALVTAVLFTAGKVLIAVYLSKSVFTTGYGAAGSLLVLLLWIYYSAQIFLLGAEFTHAFAVSTASAG
jgi:membrane protein